jgi:uncharacterized protein (TIGR03435 family)
LAAEPALAFEVASVRRNTSGEFEQFVQRQPGGRLTIRNTPLRFLVRFAYMVHGFQIQGGPDWIDSARFDIIAQAEGDPQPVAAGPDPLRLMLRTLLADRFKLVMHRETQDLPVFALTAARRDGTLGPRLRPAATDCAAARVERQAIVRSGGTPPVPVGGPDAPVTCGMRMGPGRLETGGNPLSLLADGLAGLVQRVVVDRTGLEGNWDLELTYTPDPRLQAAPPGPSAPGVPLPAVDPDYPSLFIALEEQLGLKLEPSRGRVEVLMIDSVAPPTEN